MKENRRGQLGAEGRPGAPHVEPDLRTVLIVSPHFPPSTLAGVHRARHLAKHLPSHGWRPIIVRVAETHYVERPDQALAALVPERVEQIHAGAIPARLARLVGVGDIGLRGYVPIKRAIAQAAAATKAEAVMITGSPFYPMLLSGWIKRRLKIPVILDFQDPWVSREGGLRPKWSKAGLAHRLAVALEPRVLHHADYITSVSDRQNHELAERYPWLDRSRMVAIPIGGDAEDFDALRTRALMQPSVTLDPEKINLSYVGAFWPRSGPLMHTVLRAVRSLKQSHPELARRLRLNFVGTGGLSNGHNSHCIRPLAEEEGVDDLVVEMPERVPFLEALNILVNSQGLLLIGSDEPHYTASKIYPALMSARPYVSLFHRLSSAHEILTAAGGGKAIAISNLSELPALTSELRDALVQLSTTPELFGRANPATYAAYTAHSVSGDFAKVFEKAAAARLDQ